LIVVGLQYSHHNAQQRLLLTQQLKIFAGQSTKVRICLWKHEIECFLLLRSLQSKSDNGTEKNNAFETDRKSREYVFYNS